MVLKSMEKCSRQAIIVRQWLRDAENAATILILCSLASFFCCFSWKLTPENFTFQKLARCTFRHRAIKFITKFYAIFLSVDCILHFLSPHFYI